MQQFAQRGPLRNSSLRQHGSPGHREEAPGGPWPIARSRTASSCRYHGDRPDRRPSTATRERPLHQALPAYTHPAVLGSTRWATSALGLTPPPGRQRPLPASAANDLHDEQAAGGPGPGFSTTPTWRRRFSIRSSNATATSSSGVVPTGRGASFGPGTDPESLSSAPARISGTHADRPAARRLRVAQH